MEPVFESFERVLGPASTLSFGRTGGRATRGRRGRLQGEGQVPHLIAEFDGRVVGFIAYELKGETGEVVLLAVHPEFQRRALRRSSIRWHSTR